MLHALAGIVLSLQGSLASDMLGMVVCRYKQGRPLSVLDGVPYTIIDGIDALPYPTTAGTSFVRSPLWLPPITRTLLLWTFPVN